MAVIRTKTLVDGEWVTVDPPPPKPKRKPKPKSGLTHKDLVPVAAAWLVRKGYAVVATEVVSACQESPDALGFKCSTSCMIEVKASRSDFRNDHKKHFRQKEERGVGSFRYYLCPTGIIPHDEVPPKWGLLEVSETGRVRCVLKPERDGKQYWRARCEKNLHGEIAILVSIIRRIGQLTPQGVSVKAYTIENKNTATLGILPDSLSALDNVDGGGI